jgi:hypothetical protein
MHRPARANAPSIPLALRFGAFRGVGRSVRLERSVEAAVPPSTTPCRDRAVMPLPPWPTPRQPNCDGLPGTRNSPRPTEARRAPAGLRRVGPALWHPQLTATDRAGLATMAASAARPSAPISSDLLRHSRALADRRARDTRPDKDRHQRALPKRGPPWPINMPPTAGRAETAGAYVALAKDAGSTLPSSAITTSRGWTPRAIRRTPGACSSRGPGPPTIFR